MAAHDGHNWAANIRFMDRDGKDVYSYDPNYKDNSESTKTYHLGETE